MPQKQGKSTPEGIDPVPRHDEFKSDEPTVVELYRTVEEQFDRSDKQFDELMEKKRATNQRLAGLQHGDRQPHLAKEADFRRNRHTKTSKRMEGVAAEDEQKGDIPSTMVDDGPMNLTSFGIIAELPAPEKCIGDAMINNDAEAPKPCLPPVEVRMLSSATGGLLPANTASTAMMTMFSSPPPSWTLGDRTKKRTSRTNLNQFAPPCWRKVFETKSRQTKSFTRPPISERAARVALQGFRLDDVMRYPRLERSWLSEDLNIVFPREAQAIWYAVHCKLRQIDTMETARDERVPRDFMERGA